MYSDLFIDSFLHLKKKITLYLKNRDIESPFAEVIDRAYEANDLFTPTMQGEALMAIAEHYLVKEELELLITQWEDRVVERDEEVLIVMAGNLPLVGFHDFLMSLLSGYRVLVKLSSKDSLLLPSICDIMVAYNPYWRGRIRFIERLPKEAPILIATGSDRTANYFKERYGSSKLLVRGSKSSLAILSGEESKEDIELLARDLFLYFGRGCRSVTTLMIPTDYSVEKLIKKLEHHSSLTEGSKSHDALYRYNRALAKLLKREYWESGNFLFSRDSSFPPPPGYIGVINYQSREEVESFLEDNHGSIQVVVNWKFRDSLLKFGEAQRAKLSQFADGVDTLAFLLKNS